MSADPSRSALLAALLAGDRTVADRLAAIQTLTAEELSAADAEQVLELARTERDAPVQQALLTLVAALPITIIADTAAHAAAWWMFASDPDPVVRRIAAARLATTALSRDEEGAASFAALLDDLDDDVRALALRGLTACVALPAAVADTLAAQVSGFSDADAASVLALTPQLPAPAAQRVAAALLVPWRPSALRAAAADLLRQSARVESGNQDLLHALLRDGDDASTLAWVVAVLDTVSGLDDAVLATVLERLAGSAERTAGLALLRQRLDQASALLPQLEAAVLASPRASVWRAGLEVLATSGRTTLAVAAVDHPALSVRTVAIQQLLDLTVPPWSDLEARVATRIAHEPVADLRRHYARLLARAPALSADSGRALVAHLATEDDAEVRAELGRAVLRARFTEAADRTGRWAVAGALLRDPTVAADLRADLVAFLHRAAVEEPSADVASLLLVLLDQTDAIEDIAALDRLVRTLHPDPAQQARHLHGLLRRHYHVFPQEPLTQWVRDAAAAVTAGVLDLSALIDIVRLTGAVWAVPPAAFAADRDLLRWSVQRAVGADKALDGERAIREAYEQRVIRRRDLVDILRTTAFVPHFGHLATRVIDIAQAEGVISDDLLAAAWPALCYQPHDSVVHHLLTWLVPLAEAQHPAVLARLRATATPAWHQVAVLTDVSGDFSGSPWPLFILAHAAGSAEIANLFLDIPPTVEFHRGLVAALHYLRFNHGHGSRGRRDVLDCHLLRVAGNFWLALADQPAFAEVRDRLADYLTGNRLGSARRRNSPDLRFQAWQAAVKAAGQDWDQELGYLGAQLFVDQCRRLETAPGSVPEVLPTVAEGINEKALATLWPYAVPPPQRAQRLR